MPTPHQDPIVIVGAARTPMGAFQGDFCRPRCARPGRRCHQGRRGACRRGPEKVDEVLFGNCLMAGQGQAPARQAGFKGGLPRSTGAVTLSKMCGAGMEATILAHDQLVAGSRDVMVSGGMESMTNAPYLLKKGRGGYRMGHDKIFDHMMLDGLEDAYEAGRSMGTFGEDCAAKYQFTREQQDKFAMTSVQRAQDAINSGAFKAEIAPVTFSTRKGEVTVEQDEGPLKIRTGQDPHAQARVQEGRHHHRRRQLQHQRRRCRSGADAPSPPRKSWAASRWPSIVAHATHAQEPQLVHHRPGRRHAEGAQEGRLVGARTWTCGKSTKPSPWCPWP